MVRPRAASPRVRHGWGIDSAAARLQDGAVLAGVQVAPLALGLMVVQFAGYGALGTRPSGQVIMGQIDVHLLGCRLQVHRGNAPGAFDGQNTPVKFPIFHGYWMDRHAVGVHGPAKRGGIHKGGSAERFETPLVGGAACFWRRGGNPPAPAFPRRGKRERGRPPSLLPDAIAYPLRPEPPSSRPPPQVLTATRKPEFPHLERTEIIEIS